MAGPLGFIENHIQLELKNFNESMILIHLKYAKEYRHKANLPISWSKSTITLMPKADDDCPQKIKMQKISFTNVNALHSLNKSIK